MNDLYSCYTIFVISFFYERCVAYVFFHMISHILSRRIKIDKSVFASSLELNFCKRGEKNLAETNFSDQRRRQDDICHSILNKISFICIMTYRHSVWCKKITPSLSKIEEVLSYKFYTSFSVQAGCWSKTCKVTLGSKIL